MNKKYRVRCKCCDECEEVYGIDDYPVIICGSCAADCDLHRRAVGTKWILPFPVCTFVEEINVNNNHFLAMNIE